VKKNPSLNLTVGMELLGVLPGEMSMFSIILMTLEFTVLFRRSFNCHDFRSSYILYYIRQ